MNLSRTSLRKHSLRAFTLIELLVCIAIVAVLLGLLIPSLSAVRHSARQTQCMSNQRQMVLAWTMYADSNRELAMPTASPLARADMPGSTFWWGSYTNDPNQPVDHESGFLSPFIDSHLNPGSVLECPAQAWGSYEPQPALLAIDQPTSTYGYNGYYLAPARTPGWNSDIAFRPWRRVSAIPRPSDVFIFADAMIMMPELRNTALLDPPLIYSRMYGWWENESPTTAFRHGGASSTRGQGIVVTSRADGSVHAMRGNPGWMLPGTFLGSVTTQNDPHYVPDADEWPVPGN
jgi:prepilin-type N-terminal cleavage/methylation domain-containing protein